MVLAIMGKTRKRRERICDNNTLGITFPTATAARRGVRSPYEFSQIDYENTENKVSIVSLKSLILNTNDQQYEDKRTDRADF